MKLYYAPNSCALAVHIALAEARAFYDLVLVDFQQEQQRTPEFLTVNPLGRVPVLETERGTLTEVPAIMHYIAMTHPHAALMPADPFDQALAYSFNAFLSSTVHVTFAHYFRPYRWAESEECRAELKRLAVKAYAEQLHFIEAHRFVGPWVIGQTYTLCDAYLFVMTRWLARAALSIEEYPALRSHFDRMRRREAVQRALSEQGLR